MMRKIKALITASTLILATLTLNSYIFAAVGLYEWIAHPTAKETFMCTKAEVLTATQKVLSYNSFLIISTQNKDKMTNIEAKKISKITLQNGRELSIVIEENSANKTTLYIKDNYKNEAIKLRGQVAKQLSNQQ